MGPPPLPKSKQLGDRRNTRSSPAAQPGIKSGDKNTDVQSDLTRCLVLDGNPDICDKCCNAVEAEEKGLQCENCDHWYHTKCLNMSNEEYKIANKFSALKFICYRCDTKKNQDQQETAVQDTDLRRQLAQLTTMLQNVLERLDKMENGGIRSNQDMEKQIEDMVEAKLQDALDEQRAKEAKKLNLIVVNLRESAFTDLQEAKEDDKKATEALIKEILPEDNIEIQNPIRLGKRHIGNKPRLLKISVSDEKTKWNIIKNAQKLNQNGRRQHKIYINPDSTQKERAEYKKLKEELDRRTKEGETHLKIERVGNRRQVVHRPPQEEDGEANVPNPPGGQ